MKENPRDGLNIGVVVVLSTILKGNIFIAPKIFSNPLHVADLCSIKGCLSSFDGMAAQTVGRGLDEQNKLLDNFDGNTSKD